MRSDFDTSDEQRAFAESLRRFVARDYSFEARRAVVASSEGMSGDVWDAFADLGVLALLVPTEFGGLGGRATDIANAMAVAGEALIVEPLLSTALGARLIARAATPAQKQSMLPRIAGGDQIVSFAYTEKESRYDASHVTTRAHERADGFELDGEKRTVMHAPCADTLIVSARVATTDAIGLFVVDRGGSGVALDAYRTLDEQRAADVRFDAAPARMLGDVADAVSIIDEAIDFAIALVCAEAVGAIDVANEATLDYLKTRKQFGVPIGSFQALQHRMVDMVIEGEQAQSMAALACAAVDADGEALERKRIVSAAKIRIADACRRVSQESIQLHGGMGMSDELKISHTFRRLTAIARQFGDADHHLERFASLDHERT